MRYQAVLKMNKCKNSQFLSQCLMCIPEKIVRASLINMTSLLILYVPTYLRKWEIANENKHQLLFWYGKLLLL